MGIEDLDDYRDKSKQQQELDEPLRAYRPTQPSNSHRSPDFQTYESRWLWLHITGGIVVACLIISAAYFGYQRYQMYRITQAIEAANERMHQRSLQIQHERLRAQQRKDFQTQFNSPECQFWRSHYQKTKEKRALDKITEYCP